jgi:hypothetical protein
VDVKVDGTQILTDVSYSTVTPYVILPTGIHQVEVAPPFPLPSVSDTVDLVGGTDFTIAGVLDGASITYTILLDDNSPSNANTVRLVNLSSDTPAIDVAITGTVTSTVLSNIPYKAASNYAAGLGTGVASFEVHPSGQITPLLTFTGTLGNDTINTFFILGNSTVLPASQYFWKSVPSIDTAFSWTYLPLAIRDVQVQ